MASRPGSSSCPSSGSSTTSRTSEAAPTAPTPPSQTVFATFQSEFDVAYEERGLYMLTMHPHIMGHRSRVAMLDRLIST